MGDGAAAGQKVVHADEATVVTTVRFIGGSGVQGTSISSTSPSSSTARHRNILFLCDARGSLPGLQTAVQHGHILMPHPL